MNTLEKYQADVEAAQKLLERAISSFEEAKKQEEADKQGEIMSNVNNSVKNPVRNLFNKQTNKEAS